MSKAPTWLELGSTSEPATPAPSSTSESDSERFVRACGEHLRPLDGLACLAGEGHPCDRWVVVDLHRQMIVGWGSVLVDDEDDGGEAAA